MNSSWQASILCYTLLIMKG